jgi:adenylate cyclase
MSDSWQLCIYEHQHLAHCETCDGPVELGRQNEAEPAPFAKLRDGDRTRLIIARRSELHVSRKHVLLQRQPNGEMRVTNLSGTRSIGLGQEPSLESNAVRDMPLPLILSVGLKTLRVQETDAAEQHLRSRAVVAAPGSESAPALTRFPVLLTPAADATDQNKQLLRWLQTSMGVFQSAASSGEFFQKAAQAVVDMIGLDTGRVLLLEEEKWQTRAFAAASPKVRPSQRQPSGSVLNQVRLEKRTFWELPNLAIRQASSLIDVTAVVATPLLRPDGTVIGAVYGDRREDIRAYRAAFISEVEAMLVELIGCAVAAGLARLEQEQAAVTARVQFEQFFTRELSQQLALQPDLLQGRDAEVSILFADIRGFSRISERLGPAKTVEWINDVLGTMSDCVRNHGGVLVDYIGDELMAMWGAPEQQPDHARLACLAALDMLAAIPVLSQRWLPLIEEPLLMGLGINTGTARVGNTGSRHKFKYGPLGNTVNLASRIQEATKYLRAPLLIAGSTRAQLDASFALRRLCRVRVVNIVEPVDLYELALPDQPGWAQRGREYEQALEAFERGDFHRAAQGVGNLLGQCHQDGPSLVLLSRAAHRLIETCPDLNPVWELPDK